MKVYDIDNKVLYDVPVTSQAVHEQELSKSDYVQLVWTMDEKKVLPAGSYIIPFEDGLKYRLLEPYAPNQNNEIEYKYEPQFQHPLMWLSKVPFTYTTVSSDGTISYTSQDWPYLGLTVSLLQVVVDRINELFGFTTDDTKFTYQIVGTVDTTVNVTFHSTDILSALSSIASACRDNTCEWHISWENKCLYFGQISFSKGEDTPVLKVGDNIGKVSVNSQKDAYYNVFFPQGSTRNISSHLTNGKYIASSLRLGLNFPKSITVVNAFATITKVETADTTNHNTKFDLDMAYLSTYFNQPLAKYGDNIYAVQLKIDTITVNARVENGSKDSTNVHIYSECLTSSDDADDNTDFDNFAKFLALVKVGAKVYFAGGVNKYSFPDANKETTEEAIPVDYPDGTIDTRKDKNEPKQTLALTFDSVYPHVDLYVYNVRSKTDYLKKRDTNENVVDSNGKKIKYSTWYFRLAYPLTTKLSNGKIVATTTDNGVTHYWYDYFVDPNTQVIDGYRLAGQFTANTNAGALEQPLLGQPASTDGFEMECYQSDTTITLDDGTTVKKGDYTIIYVQQSNDETVIIPTTKEEGLYPRGNAMPSLVANKVILYNIAMGKTEIKAAQDELLEKTKKEIKRRQSDLNNYSFSSYPDIFADDTKNPGLYIGKKVTFNDGNGYTLSTRVIKLSTKLDYSFEQEITVGNQKIKGATSQLKEDIDTILSGNVASNGNGGLNTTQVRNIIKAYGSTQFLSKTRDDITPYSLTVGRDLTVGGKTVTDDIHSSDSNDGNTSMSGTGWTLKNVKENGQSYSVLAVDNIVVRKKLEAAELEIHKKTYIGAQLIASDWGHKILKTEPVTVSYDSNNVYVKGSTAKSDFTVFTLPVTDNGTAKNVAFIGKPMNATETRVEVLGDSNGILNAELAKNTNAFKVYFCESDGSVSIKDDLTVGSMGMVQEFNVSERKTHDFTNTYYWGVCLEHGVAKGVDIGGKKVDCIYGIFARTTDSVTLESEAGYATDSGGNKTYKTFKCYGMDSSVPADYGTTIPVAGDDMVGFGNADPYQDVNRCNAIVMASKDGENSAPSIISYSGLGRKRSGSTSYSVEGTIPDYKDNHEQYSIPASKDDDRLDARISKRAGNVFKGEFYFRGKDSNGNDVTPPSTYMLVVTPTSVKPGDTVTWKIYVSKNGQVALATGDDLKGKTVIVNGDTQNAIDASKGTYTTSSYATGTITLSLMNGAVTLDSAGVTVLKDQVIYPNYELVLSTGALKPGEALTWTLYKTDNGDKTDVTSDSQVSYQCRLFLNGRSSNNVSVSLGDTYETIRHGTSSDSGKIVAIIGNETVAEASFAFAAATTVYKLVPVMEMAVMEYGISKEGYKAYQSDSSKLDSVFTQSVTVNMQYFIVEIAVSGTHTVISTLDDDVLQKIHIEWLAFDKNGNQVDSVGMRNNVLSYIGYSYVHPNLKSVAWIGCYLIMNTGSGWMYVDKHIVPVKLANNGVLDANKDFLSYIYYGTDDKTGIQHINQRITNAEGNYSKVSNRIDGVEREYSSIKQTAGSISLNVGALHRRGGNILPGGNVNGLFSKKYSVFVSDYFTVEEGKTYTVTANVYKDTSGSHVIDIIAFRSDWSHQYHGQTSETDPSNKYCYSFTAQATEQLRVGFYERTASGDDPGSYEGVHLNWVRVDEGDWTGEARLSEWGPADRETDAVNLLPDPSFSHGIGFTDGMGERNSYADGMGDTVSWMSRDASADGDGCHAVLFNRSSSSQTSSGIRYLIPFRGAGTYYLSYVYTDLSQTDSSYPGMTAILSAECHPCDADGNRITGGFGVYSKNTSSEDSGIIRCGQPYTFGATATNGSGTRKDIVYLEVRVFLLQRGAVRVSRICLSKSDHYIYWNANAVNESRKNDAKLLATGVNIEDRKITLTSDNTEVRTNSGKTVAVFDENGIVSQGLKMKDANGNTVFDARNGDVSCKTGTFDNINVKNSKLTDVSVNGSIRSAFKKFSNTLENINTDNYYINTTGGGWITSAGELSGTVSDIGRTVKIFTNGLGGAEITLNNCSVYTEFGQELSSSIVMPGNSYIELLGIGTDDIFKYWQITNRGDVGKLNYVHGVDIPLLAYGYVEVNYSNGSWSTKLYYDTFDGSALTLRRDTSGYYILTLPSTWFFENDVLHVMTTPYGPEFETDGTRESVRSANVMVDIQKHGRNIVFICADDNTLNDQSFFFEIKNLNEMNHYHLKA